VAALVAVLVAVVVAVCAMRWGGVAGVRAEVAAAGAWAPLLFVALQALVTITPLPRTMFTVAAGVLFGSVWGLALTITGTALAALAAYGLVRWVGGPLVARHEHRPGFAWVRARLDRSGLLAMVSLRLLPLLPFSVLNYAAGASAVRVRPYTGATLAGLLPGTAAVVVLGDALTNHISPLLILVSLFTAGLGVAGLVYEIRTYPRHHAPDEEAATEEAAATP
jgi:uncharacterized membrane protein YdjX (TVP38/TMEM64 family)